MVEKYPFDEDFAASVLALPMRIPDFVSRFTSEVVIPEYFENEYMAHILKLVYSHIENYDGIPSKKVLFEIIRKEILKDPKSRKKTVDQLETLEENYRDIVEEAFRVPEVDMNFAMDRAIDWSRYMAYKGAVASSMDTLESYTNYQRISEFFDGIDLIGSDVMDIGNDFFAEREDRASRRLNVEDEDRVSTLWPGVDRDILYGGVKMKKLCVILAPPSYGKTFALINISAAALMQKYDVVHYSLEDDPEEILERYDMRFSGLTKRSLVYEEAELMARLDWLDPRMGRLIVKGYDPGTLTMERLKNHLNLLNSNGVFPRVIILDYADEMAVPKEYATEKDYSALGRLYGDLRRFAFQRNLIIWTASQTTRDAVTKDIVTIADLGDSFKKAAKADLIMAVCQTDEERAYGVMRLFVAKNKNGPARLVKRFAVEYERMMMRYLGDDDED